MYFYSFLYPWSAILERGRSNFSAHITQLGRQNKNSQKTFFKRPIQLFFNQWSTEFLIINPLGA